MHATAATLALYTVGECRITIAAAGRSHTLTPARDRLFTLALLLAAEPGRPLPRARTAAWLWPRLAPAAARHALRQLAYRLRLLGAPLTGDEATVWLPADHVLPPDPAALAHTPLSAHCLPGWSPAQPALAAWADEYRDQTEATTRDWLARALQATANAPEVRARLAARLFELDPYHPLARPASSSPLRVRDARSPDQIPLVGRETVLATLRTHAADALAGHATAVALAADPGAGTTHLLREFAAAAQALGLSPLRATPAPVSRTFTGALAATVRALLDRPGALGCATSTLRILRRFTAAPLDPGGDTPRRRLGAAIAELARTVAAERPLLLVIDVPCTTAPERALAAAVARDLAGSAALAVFVTPTPAPDTPPLPSSAFHIVPLRPLEPADAARLATAAAHALGHPLGRDDLAWCVAVARGRPGDLIALAQACARAPGTRELPPSVAARLRHAVTTLPERTRAVATLHAQLGERATAEALAATLGRPHTAVEAALRTLERAGLPTLAPRNAPPSHRRAAARAFNVAAAAALA